MKKDTNILQAHIHSVGDTIHDAIAEQFDNAYKDVKTSAEYAPYGDTHACVGYYIDDDDDERIRENFEQDMSFDKVIEVLKKDPDFKDCVMDMVKYIAWNREA
jgi:hypothetical protein